MPGWSGRKGGRADTRRCALQIKSNQIYMLPPAGCCPPPLLPPNLPPPPAASYGLCHTQNPLPARTWPFSGRMRAPRCWHCHGSNLNSGPAPIMASAKGHPSSVPHGVCQSMPVSARVPTSPVARHVEGQDPDRTFSSPDSTKVGGRMEAHHFIRHLFIRLALGVRDTRQFLIDARSRRAWGTPRRALSCNASFTAPRWMGVWRPGRAQPTPALPPKALYCVMLPPQVPPHPALHLRLPAATTPGAVP